jgi:hypothetical protein
MRMLTTVDRVQGYTTQDILRNHLRAEVIGENAAAAAVLGDGKGGRRRGWLFAHGAVDAD